MTNGTETTQNFVQTTKKNCRSTTTNKTPQNQLHN